MSEELLGSSEILSSSAEGLDALSSVSASGESSSGSGGGTPPTKGATGPGGSGQISAEDLGQIPPR